MLTDDLIGEKISSMEVDAVLLSHPDIAQAVAFGVPDAKYGEETATGKILRRLAAEHFISQGLRNRHKIRRKKHVMLMLLCRPCSCSCSFAPVLMEPNTVFATNIGY
ncbi:Oxalate--CoA ligase, partial [Mucuna pruriens]